MLKDIVELTKFVFDKIVPQNLPTQSSIAIYDAYRALQKVIYGINLVAEHYLALDFTEGYLQNSSFGEPADKWRYFFNHDLEKLNESTRMYLTRLDDIALKTSDVFCNSCLSEIYDPKIFYDVVRDQYSVGLVSPCGFEMIVKTLNTKVDNRSYHIIVFEKVDLSTYEARVELQQQLREKKDSLDLELQKLKKYILNNYTLMDLM